MGWTCRVPHRVLVTGGAGFIGNAVVRAAQRVWPEAEVVTLDLLTYAGSLDNLADLPDPGRHAFVQGDIRDRARVREVFAEHEPDTVLHLAAESHVDRSITDPGDFVTTNVLGTTVLLEEASALWAERMCPSSCRFVMVSTDEVYGDLPPDHAPSREGDAYRPSSPYSASKAAADHLALAWRRTHGLPVSITHGSNTYGPRQYPEKFLPVVIGKALAGAPIPIYGDGRQVRDWLHVDDHAAGIVAVATRGADGQAYNLGGTNPRVNLELAQRVCAVLDDLRPEGAPHARHLTHVDDRAGHDRRYALDSSRAQAELAWSPQVGFDEGLAQTVAWYVARD